MNFYTHATPPSSNQFHPARAVGAAGLLVMAAMLLSHGAHAQSPQPAATGAPTTAAKPSAEEAKYTVAQIAQAFSFIDSNRDGQLSREEAAGFRGVARHFDEADLNKDGVLSREEFENALSGGKSR